MRVFPLFFVAILYSVYDGKAQIYYACPTLSICVLPKNCRSQNITFDVGSTDPNVHDYYEKYLCGVLEETDGFLCCSDPVGVPSDFQPDESTWYFLNDDTDRNDKLDVRIVPYPGLENYERNEEVGAVFPCPSKSVCVLSEQCPHKDYDSDYETVENLEKFSCGKNILTRGLVCCPLKALVHNLKFTTEEDSKFLQKANSQEERSEVYLELADDEILSGTKEAPIFHNLHKFVAASDKGQHSLPAADLIRDFTGRSTEYGEPWECGRTLRASLENARIFSPVGNRTAKEGDFPWHVAILTTSYKYLCSGVIVGEKIVLTAAHCIDDIVSEKLLVRVGDVDLINDYEVNTAFDVQVSLAVVHPDYDKIQLKSDIAVLELQVSLRSLHYIRPVCLPKNFNPAINRCKVAGWGQSKRSKEEFNELSPQLREASFVIIENGNCQNVLRKAEELGAFFKLQDSVLCAKGVSNADTCRGDGGGGLVCRDKDVFVLKGLVSYGVGCGLNWPGVYTDVAKFFNFIENYREFSKHKKNRTVELTEHEEYKPHFSSERPFKATEYHKSEHVNDNAGNNVQLSHEYTKQPTYEEINRLKKNHEQLHTFERPHYEEAGQSHFNEFTHDTPKESFSLDRIFYGEISKHRIEPIGKQVSQIHEDKLQSSFTPYLGEPTNHLVRPIYEEPISQYDRAIYEEPGSRYGHPIYEEPGIYYDRPIYEEPISQHDRPSYEEPINPYDRPIYEEPINQYDRPLYEEPINQYDRPIYDEPINQYDRPIYEEPINQYDRPIYEEPINQYDRPIYEEPINQYDRPIYEEPFNQYDRPIYEEPLNQHNRFLNKEPNKNYGRPIYEDPYLQ